VEVQGLVQNASNANNTLRATTTLQLIWRF